jgi:hypothetical protein
MADLGKKTRNKEDLHTDYGFKQVTGALKPGTCNLKQ